MREPARFKLTHPRGEKESVRETDLGAGSPMIILAGPIDFPQWLLDWDIRIDGERMQDSKK